jgi:Kef-type K+ transport system membrane component KefB
LSRHERGDTIIGCLLDIVVGILLFVLIGLVAGEAHSSHGSVSIHLTTLPTLVFVALLLVYFLGYRRPRRRRRAMSKRP